MERMKFGYEDTDQKIEIDLYGLIFEIKSFEKIEEYNKIDKKDANAIENIIKFTLGENAIDEINNKRKEDGKEELNLAIELNILGCIFEAYSNAMSNNVLGKIKKSVNNINENVNNMNRQQRRYNDRRNYRKNYRRY